MRAPNGRMRVFPVLIGLAAATLAIPAAAQAPLNIRTPAAEQHAAVGERATREQELERLRADQRRAAEAEAKLKGEIEAIGQDRRKLTQSLVDTAARLREAEERIASSETRLAALDEKERDLRQRLYARRGVIAELLAALQRIGHRPPPALLVRPEDALKTVRSAILLGAVLPAMRGEAEALAADLSAQVTVRQAIAAEREALAADMAALTAERTRMAALIEERQKRQTEAERALEIRARTHRRARPSGRYAQRFDRKTRPRFRRDSHAGPTPGKPHGGTAGRVA